MRLFRPSTRNAFRKRSTSWFSGSCRWIHSRARRRPPRSSTGSVHRRARRRRRGAFADNYLTSAIVGRGAELERIQAVVHDRSRNAPAGLVIEGATGTGVSRLLSELALRARLTGATVLTVDGSTCQGPYSGIRTLIRKLFEVTPNDAHATIGADVGSAPRISGAREAPARRRARGAVRQPGAIPRANPGRSRRMVAASRRASQAGHRRRRRAGHGRAVGGRAHCSGHRRRG